MDLINIGKLCNLPKFQQFYISDCVVTCSEYIKVRNWAIQNGYKFGTGYNNGSNYPITNVSWIDCILFCNAFSEKTGLEPVYKINDIPIKTLKQAIYKNVERINFPIIDNRADGYKLPTEAQWECAASNGWVLNSSDVSRESGSTDDPHKYINVPCKNINCEYCSRSFYLDDPEFRIMEIEPVKSREPNSFGLYSMIGNVLEWTQNAWSNEYQTYSLDINNLFFGIKRSRYYRVVKGSSFGISNFNMNIQDRIPVNIFFRLPNLGIRIVKRV